MSSQDWMGMQAGVSWKHEPVPSRVGTSSTAMKYPPGLISDCSQTGNGIAGGLTVISIWSWDVSTTAR